MRLVSWNVNGLRSVHKKNFLEWFKKEDADIICLQEIKIGVEDVEASLDLVSPHDYLSHWHFAVKPGYSGLAIYSKQDPVAIRVGLGDWQFDSEGRWMEADFEHLRGGGKGEGHRVTVINTYWPNSQREHTRLPYKLQFCKAAELRLEALRAEGRTVYICGDFNIAHTFDDLANPKTNLDNAGFLPEERGWMDHFVNDLGWVDTFREFTKGNGHYTWWSYRPGVREKNIGWRLDYFFANPEARHTLAKVEHLTQVFGSDHCPVRLTVKPGLA
jgi:exodeoxyribonuclease-3